MPSKTDEKIWYRTEFAFASSDRCTCSKHRSRNGKPRKCGIRATVIGLTDPDKPGNDLHRLYCLDCWMSCRNEKSVINPAQQRMWDQNRRDGMTLVATGC